MIPCRFGLGVEHGVRETKVELDGRVAAGTSAGRLGRRLAKILPARVAGKTVLRKFARFVIGGRGAKDLGGRRGTSVVAPFLG